MNIIEQLFIISIWKIYASKLGVAFIDTFFSDREIHKVIIKCTYLRLDGLCCCSVGRGTAGTGRTGDAAAWSDRGTAAAHERRQGQETGTPYSEETQARGRMLITVYHPPQASMKLTRERTLSNCSTSGSAHASGRQSLLSPGSSCGRLLVAAECLRGCPSSPRCDALGDLTPRRGR